MQTTYKKRIALWIAVVVVVLIGIYCLLRFGFSIDVFDRSGWESNNGTLRYLDYFGRPQTGWHEIDGKSYYFAAEDGAMVTGWRKIGDEQYYFQEDGTPATGWLHTDGKHYYFGDNGAMATGQMHLDGKTYYFAPGDGAMAVGWLQMDDKPYYFTQDGHTVSGWVELDGVRYRFNEDGSAVTGWFEDETGRYFFGKDGRPGNGWLQWEQRQYYLKADGSVTTGWLNMEQDRYYFLTDGAMAIGEVKIDGISRFFTSTGKEVLLANPWHAVPEDHVLNLVDIEGKKINAEVKDPLQQMMDDCRAAGIHCVINNSYRSRATQQWMWDRRIAERMAAGMTKEQAEKVTGETLAIPGHSEHQTGLAVDITGSQKLYDWLAEHCWDYGFILRYPDDRYDITGIIFEPWHFRYVGTELSMELKELGLCMEEYMAMLTQQQKEIAK